MVLNRLYITKVALTKSDNEEIKDMSFTHLLPND